MKRRGARFGPIELCDPLALCCVLYALLYFDASGFLRLGLLAAVLHELGHVAVYWCIKRRCPRIAVTATGFCMRTRGEKFAPWQLLCLAAAGPAANAALAALWAAKMSRQATVSGSAFMAANVLTGAFNLLPIPPLDGAQMLAAARAMRAKTRCK